MRPHTRVHALALEATNDHVNAATDAGHTIDASILLSMDSPITPPESLLLSLKLYPCTSHAMLRSMKPLMWNL